MYYKIDKIQNFNLAQTLECGQCFHFQKISENAYEISAYGKILTVEEKNDSIVFYDTTESEFHDIWEYYFDFKRDYSEIQNKILKSDPELCDIVGEYSGIHILNQDFFETLISFIISQNKQIPQIKQVVRNISEKFGSKSADNIHLKSDYKCISDYQNLYIFPTIEQASHITEDDFRACKAGFRAPYLIDAVKNVKDGKVTSDKISTLSNEDALKMLMTIKGVGEKVANCVMLFSCGRRDAFPVDVWMKRIMEKRYFHEDTPKEKIAEYGREKYGEYAGYAQQYLFIYGKNNRV